MCVLVLQSFDCPARSTVNWTIHVVLIVLCTVQNAGLHHRSGSSLYTEEPEESIRFRVARHLLINRLIAPEFCRILSRWINSSLEFIICPLTTNPSSRSSLRAARLLVCTLGLLCLTRSSSLVILCTFLGLWKFNSALFNLREWFVCSSVIRLVDVARAGGLATLF